MKTILEYLQSGHINASDSDYIISESIRKYVKAKWGWGDKNPSDELVPGLPIQDIFDVKESPYVIYCEHENVYLHIKSSKEQYGTYVVAIFTRVKDEPTDKEYASWASANYQYNTRQKTNHLFNFWQMLNYAISNSDLAEI